MIVKHERKGGIDVYTFYENMRLLPSTPPLIQTTMCLVYAFPYTVFQRDALK